MKKRILIDLDGVLNVYTKYEPDFIPPPRDGVKEFLGELNKEYEVVLFTTRNLLQAVSWLKENELDKYFSDVTNIKLPAVLHVDDRTICFMGDFKEALNKIKSFKVYWNGLV